MTSNRRTPHASSLRHFFDEHLHQLHEMAHSIEDYFQADHSVTDSDRQLIENFVDVANKKMRIVNHYADKLRASVVALHNHVLQVAEQLPEPVSLDPSSFSSNPLVNALFVGQKDIEKLFNSDPIVNTYQRQHPLQPSPVYGILTTSKSEKSQLGVGMLGDMLVRDVPQRTVNFSKHKIHVPCSSDSELAINVRHYLFDQVVDLMRMELGSRLAAQSFNTSDQHYQAKVSSLANPEVYLDTLLTFLHPPNKLLGLEKQHYRLSKQGIKLDPEYSSQSINEFDLYEIVLGDGSRHALLQFEYHSS